MKICVLGSGGREHALCDALSKSKKVMQLFCCPGNAGTAKIAKNHDLDLEKFEDIKKFVLKYKIDLVVVGPEKLLVDGLVDYLERHDIKVFGPNKKAAQLEGSKIFTKKLCEKYKIPTAKFGIFNKLSNSKKFLETSKYPIVIKADSLAAGKGVYICEKRSEAYSAVEDIFNGKFGEAKNVLIEEFIDGEEMSFFVISDGLTIKNFGTAQDHKRVLDGDRGKNTGGMGAYSPSRLINDVLEKKILNKIIKPTIKALKDLKTEYKGFLYTGLMISNNEPYLIEYNVRMGDPECQTILPRLDSNFDEILLACCEKKLNQIKIEWKNKKSLCVVLCSNGYPEKYKKNIEIKKLEKVNFSKNDYLFHAGTYEENKKIYASGGRVLNFVSIGSNFIECKKNVYNKLKELNWNEGFYRNDIGYKVIK